MLPLRLKIRYDRSQQHAAARAIPEQARVLERPDDRIRPSPRGISLPLIVQPNMSPLAVYSPELPASDVATAAVPVFSPASVDRRQTAAPTKGIAPSTTATARVLHVINGEHYSGAERVQDLLARQLPQFGYEIGFACVSPCGFPKSRETKTRRCSKCRWLADSISAWSSKLARLDSRQRLSIWSMPTRRERPSSAAWRPAKQACPLSTTSTARPAATRRDG